MGRTVAVAGSKLAIAFVAAMAVGLVLTLVLITVSGKSFVDELHLVLIAVGVLTLLCAAASQSPTRRGAGGPGYDRLGALAPGLNRWVTSQEAAATGSLTPTAVFLVVGIAILVIAFAI
jgi:hypothetical protein